MPELRSERRVFSKNWVILFNIAARSGKVWNRPAFMGSCKATASGSLLVKWQVSVELERGSPARTMSFSCRCLCKLYSLYEVLFGCCDLFVRTGLFRLQVYVTARFQPDRSSPVSFSVSAISLEKKCWR